MIRVLRSLVAIFCFTLFGAGAGVISFLIFPYISITKPKDKQKEAYSEVIRKSWSFFSWVMSVTGVLRIHVCDKEKFENLSGKIVVANHPTFIDVVILLSMIPKSTCLAKKETLLNPLFNNIVRSIFIINNIDLDTLKADTDKYLKEGFNIIIFPSGTRTKPGEDFKIHKGPAAIALNSGAEILPVKIKTDYPFLQKGQLFCDLGDRVINYTVETGEVINPADFNSFPEIKARNAISDLIKKRISD